ncbi:Crnkl1 [Symbiodinium sp. CCMP2592]|nr:Crnkl1 [Symbiodinium sp. CCMP2592]
MADPNGTAAGDAWSPAEGDEESHSTRPRIWEAPRGPPPPIPVNEPQADREARESRVRIQGAVSMRVSGAIIQTLSEVGFQMDLVLTDVDQGALEGGCLGVHVSRLPPRGEDHPWAVWNMDDGETEGDAAAEEGTVDTLEETDAIGSYGIQHQELQTGLGRIFVHFFLVTQGVYDGLALGTTGYTYDHAQHHRITRAAWETGWPMDSEYVATLDLISSDHIRYHVVEPGRLLHVRKRCCDNVATCGTALLGGSSPSLNDAPASLPVILIAHYSRNQFFADRVWLPHMEDIQIRTYVPPNATPQQGSQIDYILVRGTTPDPIAKKATIHWAPTTSASPALRDETQKGVEDWNFDALSTHYGHNGLLFDRRADCYIPGAEQAHTRALRKACRHKKTEKVAEAVQATNIHQAAKRFAPKTPKRRIQLRREDGGLQTHEAEFRQIVQHFTSLYHAADMEPPRLSADLCIEGVEIDNALCRLQPGKAMPSCNAPAALWKRFRQDLVPLLQRQFAWHLRPGVSNLPEAWTLCELAKILASIVAQRLKEPAKAYLASLPQFAYVVRGLVQGNTRNIHNKRSGRTSLSLYGGCQLSLDLTSAYDLVQWPLLRLALIDAAIPEPLIQLIMLVHHSAKLALQHCGLKQTVSLKRGLRQGCSLSPTLWAIFSGWLLKRMHDPQLLNVHETNTSYADDQHYRWTIREGKDLEVAYAGMKHVLACLLNAGMLISQDKTVVILELQGAQAARALARYTVERPQGKCFRFVIADQTLYLKIVPKHVYLGAVVGFRHFEQDTFKHRLSLARCTFSRLGVILRNRGVPLRLRLQLWQGCVWPALFHALDCTGLPQKELQTLQTQLIKQARAIAKSHSMLTKETNQAFIRRLRLPDPVQRLQNALMQRVTLDETLSPVLAPGPGQLQWRTIVRGHLFDGRNEWALPDTIASAPTTTPAARLEEVQEVLSEIFKCDDCGQEFATQAALRRHVFLTHLSQQQQLDRSAEVKESIKGAEMAHASVLPEITEALIALCTAMFDNMLMRPEQAIPSELTAATHELSLLRNLVSQQAGMGAMGPQGSQERRPMEWHMETDPEDKDMPSRRDKPEGRQPKWHKPDQKGGQKGGQKGKGRNSQFGPASRSNSSWKNNGNPQASSGNRWWQTDGDKMELSRAELQEIKNVLNMVSTLVIRQEVQQNIQRQDTGFMVFVQTQVPDNLAQSMYQIGKTWHDTKRDNPTALRHPMRVTLYQHFVQTIKERFQAMMRTPSSRSKAESLGWVSSCGRKVHGLKWDTTQQAHVQDETIASMDVVEIEEALDELLTCAPQQLVIQRFHATRQLAAEYQSPVITMFLEVGMRRMFPEARAPTDECFGKTPLHIDTVKSVQLGNKHCFCYANALMMSLLYLDCSMEGQSLFSGDAARVVGAILQSAGQIFHLWEQGEWLSMMKGWAQPTRQHDVAEFLAFLTKCPFFNFDKVALSWQARSAAAAGNHLIQDLGYSIPLTLVPPCDVGLDSGAIILQVSRFHYDSQSGRPLKRAAWGIDGNGTSDPSFLCHAWTSISATSFVIPARFHFSFDENSYGFDASGLSTTKWPTRFAGLTGLFEVPGNSLMAVRFQITPRLTAKWAHSSWDWLPTGRRAGMADPNGTAAGDAWSPAEGDEADREARESRVRIQGAVSMRVSGAIIQTLSEVGFQMDVVLTDVDQGDAAAEEGTVDTLEETAIGSYGIQHQELQTGLGRIFVHFFLVTQGVYDGLALGTTGYTYDHAQHHRITRAAWETGWPMDSEYVATLDLISSDHIRYHVVEPGRLLHVRKRCCDNVATCGTALLGGSSPSLNDAPASLPVILIAHYSRNQFFADRVWLPHMEDIQIRTYVPPNATPQQGSQIDYILVRGTTPDPIAKKATIHWAPTTSASPALRDETQKGVEDWNFDALSTHYGHNGLLFDRRADCYIPGAEQAHTRALRKACRHKKTEKVAEAVQATNIHQAAKRFAPKTPKRRIQLRREDGGLQTHEAEFRQIVQHFTSLYHAADMEPPRLSADLCIEGVEIDNALCRLQPGKAMPSCNAPAALWKRFRQDLVPLLQRQFAWHLRPGVSNLPEAWTLCELAKILASIVAQRLKEPAKAYLASLPQFAYVVRGLVQGNTRNIHNKRSGRTSLSLYGGCQLSLDLTSAYDLVQWPLLRLALIDAAIPEPLIQLIMLVHHSAKLALQHCGLKQTVSLKRGLRQGCSLSPTLWAIFSGWLLKRMHDPQLLNVHETNTSYADDQHYRWTIREGKDLEVAYAGMKHVLACLLNAGMLISQDKTVVILELQGAQAARALARYTVERPQGKCFRFVIADQTLYLKIVPKHVYLGAVVGFRHFEQDTFKHRLSLARCTFSRLGVILRNRGVPLRLRLQLWQGCVWPALFHALDCTGLPQKELQTLQTQLIKQARAIAKSHSMLTKETNQAFIRRLRLPDPVQRLQNALMQRVTLDETLSPVLAPGPGQLQWRTIVRGHLFDGRNEWALPDTIASAPTTTPAARLEEVQEVLSEIFKCDDCGQEFATQAALRRHVFLTHLSQQQQLDRSAEVKESIKGAEMAHASVLPEITEALIALCTAMFDNMLMRPEQAIPSELTAATHELSLLRNLVSQQAGMGAMGPQGSQERRPMEWHMETDPEDKDMPSRRDKPEGRQPKWHKPDQKGGQKGGQKGKGRNSQFGPASRSNSSWKKNGNPQASSGNRWWQTDGDKMELSRAELQEIKNVLNMVSTLVIRQEVQQNIQRQDTGFMVFVQTQVPDNLAQSMYQIGKTWHDTKRDNPTALRHPMRVTLYQHFVQTIKERFQAMMRTPSSRSKAESLGWVSSCGRKVHGLKWDTTQQAHVQDETIASMDVVEIEEALDELLTCAPQQLVIQRFHATRQLAAEYQSPVITMFLEVGMRRMFPEARAPTDECFGKTPLHIDTVKSVQLGNKHCFCYANALMMSLLYLDCSMEGQSLFSGDAARVVGAILQSAGQIFHLWEQGEWLSMMKGWAQPTRQHDVAEFLAFLTKLAVFTTTANREGL